MPLGRRPAAQRHYYLSGHRYSTCRDEGRVLGPFLCLLRVAQLLVAPDRGTVMLPRLFSLCVGGGKSLLSVRVQLGNNLVSLGQFVVSAYLPRRKLREGLALVTGYIL